MVKISLSKPRPGHERQVVVLTDPRSYPDVDRVLLNSLEARGRRSSKHLNGRRLVLWKYPMRHLEQLMLALPFADLSPGLNKWRNRHLMQEFDLGPVPDMEVPDLLSDLFDFQKIGIERMGEDLFDCEDGPVAHICQNDEMGLGKTLQALCVIRFLKSQLGGRIRVLVICPNNGKRVWRRQASEHFGDAFEVTVVEGTARQRAEQIESPADIVAINFESVWRHDEIYEQEWDLVVVDEFHRMKNPTAKQTKGIMDIESPRKLLMSGTPLLNTASDLWAPMHYAFPEFRRRWPTVGLFERYFCIFSEGKRYKKVIGYKNLHELRDFLNIHSIRRRKDQVLRDLPETLPVTIPVVLTDEQRELYDQIRDDFRLALASGEVRTIRDIRSWITRLKQACFSPELYGGSAVSAKIEELRDVNQQLVNSGEKAILFSSFSRATRILQREFAQYSPAYVDGSVTGRKREEEQDRFNNDPDCKLYIGTIGANRESISLGAASYVIFSDKAWSPLANDQATGRSAAGGLRGMGQRGRKIHVVTLEAVDTVEQRIEEVLAGKRNLFNAVVEADGGLPATQITIESIASLL